MNSRHLLRLLVYTFLTISSFPLFGQFDSSVSPYDTTGLSRKERKSMAKEAYFELNKGYLVVRLTSNLRKMEALEETINKPDINPDNKKRLIILLDETKVKTIRENKEIVTAFREKYDFSTVLFMFDTASTSLKRGVKSGIFLNDSLELDKSIRLPDGVPFYVMRYGPYGTRSDFSSFVTMDSQLQDLRKPFPVFNRANTRSYRKWKKLPSGKVRIEFRNRSYPPFQEVPISHIVAVMNGTLHYNLIKAGLQNY